jgi:hypothetical protein
MSIAFPVTEMRGSAEWIVAMTSLAGVQLLGVAVALHLSRLKPNGRQTPAMRMKPELTQEQAAVQAGIAAVDIDESAAEESKSAIREIWRRVPNP